jgi:hypothetical protein
VGSTIDAFENGEGPQWKWLRINESLVADDERGIVLERRSKRSWQLGFAKDLGLTYEISIKEQTVVATALDHGRPTLGIYKHKSSTQPLPYLIRRHRAGNHQRAGQGQLRAAQARGALRHEDARADGRCAATDWRRAMKRGNRAAYYERYKARCREEICQYREALVALGLLQPRDVPRWDEPYPENRPEAGRVRFLQIWALGGPMQFEAAPFGLWAKHHSVRSTYLIGLATRQGEEVFSYQLNLWVRPGQKADGACTRQHTAKGCDAELHDGWNGEYFRKTRRRSRKGKIFARGTVQHCLSEAERLFRAWDAAARLGGLADSQKEFIA